MFGRFTARRLPHPGWPVWFPTTKGVVSVNPADIKTNRQPPLVMIESVLVDGQEQK